MFNSNKIYKIDKNGNRKQILGVIPGLVIRFRGKNSTITIKEPMPKFKRCSIILGNNCSVEIGDSNQCIKRLDLKAQINNGKFYIGKNLNANSCAIYCAREDDITVKIGDDCLFANDVIIRASDSHSITDLEGHCQNKSNHVIIGNHVWCTYGVNILKNIKIADNIVIGYKSIVTKDCDISNSVYAGTPAKLVKNNINWNENRPKKEDI